MQHILIIIFFLTSAIFAGEDGYPTQLQKCAQCPHLLPHAQREALFNATFGQIKTSFVHSQEFQNLKTELLKFDNPTHPHFMNLIAHVGNPNLFGPHKEICDFDLETEEQYRTAAHHFVSTIFNVSHCDQVCDSAKDKVFRITLSALLTGFDQLVLHFTQKGLEIDERGFDFLNIPLFNLQCLQNNQEYHIRRTHHIAALKYWLKKAMADAHKRNQTPQAVRILSIYHLRDAFHYGEPEVFSLLKQHGAQANVPFTCTPNNMQWLKQEWLPVFENAAFIQNPAFREGAIFRHARTWDVIATFQFFPAFAALKEDKASYVSVLPQELIEEIRKFRLGISID